MIEVAQGVSFIPGQDDFIPDSHVYVLGDPASQDLSLVDAGLVGKGGYKMGAIRQMGIDPAAIKRIIMTHTHLDHIGCLPEILKEIPEAELWVQTLEGEQLEQGDERTVHGMDMFRSMAEMQFGIKPGDYTFQVQRKLEGGDTLDIGGMTWEVIHISGHSMGGIALYNRGRKILIPGDVVYADYAIGRFDLYGADASALKKSLYNLAELEVDILLPGHNRIVQELPDGYILQTAKQWEAYLT
jgi:glyoxylase-like metal-dependent hydrolase (beta-lactamase superfamily II)